MGGSIGAGTSGEPGVTLPGREGTPGTEGGLIGATVGGAKGTGGGFVFCASDALIETMRTPRVR
jgi:hypothetical protein